MKILVVVSASALWNIEERCLTSILNQDAQESHSIDLAISTNRGELPSLKLEPKHLNRIASPLLNQYDYIFPMQSDIILPEDALSFLLDIAVHNLGCVVLALVSFRKSTLEEADRLEGAPNHIRELGHYQVTFLNGRVLERNLALVRNGTPFIPVEPFYSGWNCNLIPSKVLHWYPFTEDRSFDITWSDDLQRANVPMIVDPRVKVGHIDRDGRVCYGVY